MFQQVTRMINFGLRIHVLRVRLLSRFFFSVAQLAWSDKRLTCRADYITQTLASFFYLGFLGGTFSINEVSLIKILHI